MKRIRLLMNVAIFLLLIILNFIIFKIYFYQNEKVEARRLVLQAIETDALPDWPPKSVIKTNELKTDKRIAYLHQFFRKYDSVLYDKAEFVVKMADQYQIDYRLIPAIAMQESNLCKKIPPNSHNCWGWGIYGDTVTRFDSYEQAIETISRGLKRDYIDKGLTKPDDIMRKYTPPSTGSWARAVNYFFDVIE